MRCLEIERFDFLRNKFVYALLFLLTGLLGYFAYNMINSLPNPGTIPEFIKYYFRSPNIYFKATLLTFSAFFASISLGASTILQGAAEDLHIAVKIFIIVLGVIIIVISFYFFSYFILLIVSILILVAIFSVLLSDNGKGRRR